MAWVVQGQKCDHEDWLIISLHSTEEGAKVAAKEFGKEYRFGSAYVEGYEVRE